MRPQVKLACSSFVKKGGSLTQLTTVIIIMSLTYGSLAHDLMFQNGFEGKTCPIVSILTLRSFINEMSHCHRDHHHHYSKFTIQNKTWGYP